MDKVKKIARKIDRKNKVLRRQFESGAWNSTPRR